MRIRFSKSLLFALVMSFALGQAPSSVANDRLVVRYDSLLAAMSDEPSATTADPIPPVLTSLFERDGDLWSGAYYDGDQLNIGYVGQSAATARDSLDQLGIRQDIQLFLADSSSAQLAAAYHHLVHAADPDITAIGLSVANSRILVGVRSLSPNVSTLLQSVLPVDSAVFLFDGLKVSASRYYEANPFSGGAMYYANHSSAMSQPGLYCSFGFALNPPTASQPILVTAGHCKSNLSVDEGAMTTLNTDTVMRLDPGPSSGTLDDKYVTIGTFVTGSLQITEPVDSHPILSNVSGRSGDWAIISLNPLTSGPRASAAQIYVGLGDTSMTKPVSSAVSLSWLSNNKNSVFYTSGASGYTQGNPNLGRVRMDSVNSFPGVFTLSSAPYGTHTYISGLWYGTDSQGGGCVVPGDSGGPVYRNLSDGSVAAVGIVSAWLAGSPCINFFTPISTVLSQYGGSVKVA